LAPRSLSPALLGAGSVGGVIRAFQWDLARQVERLDWLLQQLPRYADWGYQEVYLHLEDAADYPSLPGVARADAYSWTEFERLVATAQRHGLGVVPIINLLGHTQYLIKTPQWRDLNELRGPDGSPLERGQICPLHPRTAEVAARLLQDVAPFCTTGKVHVGLDESFHLGKHPLSQAEVAEVGLATHFARYVQRLHHLASGHELRLGLWADMLALLPEAIRQLPRGIVAYDWFYHGFSRHPRLELYNFAEYDLAPALHARGIEYWGCPMNGAFRFEPLPVFGERLANAQAWWRRCRQTSAGGFLVTSWEAYRLAAELPAVVDAAIASLWLDPEISDHPGMLARGFKRMFAHTPATRAARTALATDEAAFAGYARWELNERWDVISTHETVLRAEREARLHRRLAARPELPSALAASLRFRAYLADRDAFVRRAAKGVWKLRRQAAARIADPTERRQLIRSLRADAGDFARLLAAGRQAAREMWGRTREAETPGQNEHILDLDTARLQSWRKWLSAAVRRPSHVHRRTPVAGAWQLQFVVINERPAVQRVVVEQQAGDGEWRELRGRHTIEFRTAVARPKANVRRHFVTAVDEPWRPLRLAVHGVGQVRIAHPELTDGVTLLRPLGWRIVERRPLGVPAPSSGWPILRTRADADVLPLDFPRETGGA
jgi:hypothetical protein